MKQRKCRLLKAGHRREQVVCSDVGDAEKTDAMAGPRILVLTINSKTFIDIKLTIPNLQEELTKERCGGKVDPAGML